VNRIWLDKDCTICAVVSDEDYAWALQWRWQITWDRHKRKAYATRSTKTHGGRRIKYYLHKEILIRSLKLPPSPRHTMGDHGDGVTARPHLVQDRTTRVLHDRVDGPLQVGDVDSVPDEEAR